jgi:hypothetical protein
MIGALNPHVLTGIALTLPQPQRAHFIAACPARGCSHLASTGHARACTRTDCGFVDRHAGGVSYDTA